MIHFLSLCNSPYLSFYRENFEKMPTKQHNIFIEESYTSSQTLKLSDRGRKTQVSGGDTVTWHISPGSGVTSIRIQGKLDSSEIFSIPPHKQGAVWRGVIMSAPTPCTEWEYSIFWKDNENSQVEYEYDPKISVKPTPFTNNILMFISSFLLACFSIFTLRYLFRSKSRK